MSSSESESDAEAPLKHLDRCETTGTFARTSTEALGEAISVLTILFCLLLCPFYLKLIKQNYVQP